MNVLAEIGNWLDVLGCPHCRGRLQLDNEVLGCLESGHRFPAVEGTVSFVREEDRARLAALSGQYRQDRLGEGWRSLPPQCARALPYGSFPGCLPLYWEVRRQSYRALMRFLTLAGPPAEGETAADLGAGMGWLAYRLAQAGYRVVAVEANLDPDFGLRAAEVYQSLIPERFMPIHGDMEHPPLRRGAISLLLFDASLHYARDLVGTLCRAAEVLRPGGHLVVLDTPISRQPQMGSGLGERRLGRKELHEALLAAGLKPRWLPVLRGPGWWLCRVKAWLKRDTWFAFPLILGTHAPRPLSQHGRAGSAGGSQEADRSKSQDRS
jgi:SAM-dependent methyltransferase/uncharacterized protein YbaR (Trm112 family)